MVRLHILDALRSHDLLAITLRKTFIHKNSKPQPHIAAFYALIGYCIHLFGANECPNKVLFVLLYREKAIALAIAKSIYRSRNVGLHLHLSKISTSCLCFALIKFGTFNDSDI